MIENMLMQRVNVKLMVSFLNWVHIEWKSEVYTVYWEWIDDFLKIGNGPWEV